MFRCKRIVYTAEKVHIKYFVKNWLFKTALPYVQTVAWHCCYCNKFRLFKFVEYTTQGTAGSWNVLLNNERPPHQIENIIQT